MQCPHAVSRKQYPAPASSLRRIFEHVVVLGNSFPHLLEQQKVTSGTKLVEVGFEPTHVYT